MHMPAFMRPTQESIGIIFGNGIGTREQWWSSAVWEPKQRLCYAEDEAVREEFVDGCYRIGGYILHCRIMAFWKFWSHTSCFCHLQKLIEFILLGDALSPALVLLRLRLEWGIWNHVSTIRENDYLYECVTDIHQVSVILVLDDRFLCTIGYWEFFVIVII